jgi:hypothetical protein
MQLFRKCPRIDDANGTQWGCPLQHTLQTIGDVSTARIVAVIAYA